VNTVFRRLRSPAAAAVAEAQGGSGKAPGFDRPTRLPRDEQQRRRWQIANRAWWEAAPMRYDWREALRHPPGSKAYFREIDQRFFQVARCFLPWRQMPFDTLIDFADLAAKDVLEIGVGHGSHAHLLASHCRSFIGIDLTAAAVQMVARRFALFAVPGAVTQMDAERMAFADNSFDYIWSWGVIHQTADTSQVLAEMHRVMRPGGTCAVMVYYRSWWNYAVCGFLRSILIGEGLKRGGVHRAAQCGTDGAIARYYKPKEWRAAVGDLFAIESLVIYGLKSDVVPLPYGRLKQWVINAIPDRIARFLTARLRMGSLLVARMRKVERS
jgi:SAM-dependent methyltransferase